jgi:DNA-binding transcriptional MerR regulator
MATYSIADIEKLSGVKAHTIRIWEKRYGICSGKRSETNIRYYDDDDLKYILNVAFLNREGMKISKIAKLSQEEIKQEVADQCNLNKEETEVDSLMLSIFELNEYKFLKIVNHHITDFGFEKTMDDIIYPLLDKLSLLWMSNSIKNVHENFVSSIIRRKISAEINKLDPVFDLNAKKFLIYLPEQEASELSLLFIYYVLRKKGVNVLYLGAQIPLIDIIEGVRIYKPDYILTIFNDAFSEQPLQPYLDELRRFTPGIRKIISGYQTIKQNLMIYEDYNIINDVKHIVGFVEEQAEAHSS